MSTKCTVAYSHDPKFDFHFYKECFDDDNVYLELRGENIEYEAHQSRVMVRIPVEIWEAMRSHEVADIEYANWSDEQVEELVSSTVDGRITRLSFAGCMIYGSPHDPRETQIAKGLTIMKEMRDEHTRRLQMIEQLQAENRRH